MADSINVSVGRGLGLGRLAAGCRGISIVLSSKQWIFRDASRSGDWALAFFCGSVH